MSFPDIHLPNWFEKYLTMLANLKNINKLIGIKKPEVSNTLKKVEISISTKKIDVSSNDSEN